MPGQRGSTLAQKGQKIPCSYPENDSLFHRKIAVFQRRSPEAMIPWTIQMRAGRGSYSKRFPCTIDCSTQCSITPYRRAHRQLGCPPLPHTPAKANTRRWRTRNRFPAPITKHDKTGRPRDGKSGCLTLQMSKKVCVNCTEFWELLFSEFAMQA